MALPGYNYNKALVSLPSLFCALYTNSFQYHSLQISRTKGTKIPNNNSDVFHSLLLNEGFVSSLIRPARYKGINRSRCLDNFEESSSSQFFFTLQKYNQLTLLCFGLHSFTTQLLN
jgi:hypothetical protein